MLIRGAQVEGQVGEASLRDVRVVGARIVELASRLEAIPDERVVDAAGGVLLPGLHDHHIHLMALALAERSVRCGPSRVRSREDLALAIRTAALSTPAGEWLRGTGYHESVAGPLDRASLDAFAPGRSVRIQHRGGALWMLSSKAIEELGLDRGIDAPGVERDPSGRATGRLFRLDEWLRARLPSPSAPPNLASVGTMLARFGVTGITDTTPTNSAREMAAFESAASAGDLRQNLLVMGTPDLPVVGSSLSRVRSGALKLQLDEAELPLFEDLVASIAAAHAGRRSVALHCVTRAELVFALAAVREAGVLAGDRIEHASVAPPEPVAELAELGLTVVTQPHFIRERGDTYRAEVETVDQPWLYRCQGWLDAGVPLAGGTDAPFGEPDPWLAMQSAVERRSELGYLLGEREALSPERALDLFTSEPDSPGGPRRRIDVGAVADLCLLDGPWKAMRDTLSSTHVRATIVGGALIWDRDSPPAPTEALAPGDQ